jgi:hypothetical protein
MIKNFAEISFKNSKKVSFILRINNFGKMWLIICNNDSLNILIYINNNNLLYHIMDQIDFSIDCLYYKIYLSD